MSDEPLVRERRGEILVARINRPEVRNAINGDVMRALADVVGEAESGSDTRAVVITATGDRAFSAGADLKEMAAGGDEAPQGFVRLVDGDVSFPVIAAVNGIAVGAGCELALAADVVIASAGASFGLPEVKRGLFSGSGAVSIARKLPMGLAMELALSGEPVAAQRAYEIGLVNRVVEPGGLLDAAVAMAETFAANAPLGLRATKELVRLAAAGSPDTQERLRYWQELVYRSDDAREGAMAFMEKRTPVWRAR